MANRDSIYHRVAAWAAAHLRTASARLAARRTLRAFGRSMPAARQVLAVAAALALAASFTEHRSPQQWLLLVAFLVGSTMLVKAVPSVPPSMRRAAASVVVFGAAGACVGLLGALAWSGIRNVLDAERTASAEQIARARADLAARRPAVLADLSPELRAVIDGMYHQMLERLDAGDVAGAMRLRASANQIIHHENVERVQPLAPRPAGGSVGVAEGSAGAATNLAPARGGAHEAPFAVWSGSTAGGSQRFARAIPPPPRLIPPFLEGPGGDLPAAPSRLADAADRGGVAGRDGTTWSAAFVHAREKGMAGTPGGQPGKGDMAAERASVLVLSVHDWPAGEAVALEVTAAGAPGPVLLPFVRVGNVVSCTLSWPHEVPVLRARVLGTAHGLPVLSAPLLLDGGRIRRAAERCFGQVQPPVRSMLPLGVLAGGAADVTNAAALVPGAEGKPEL